MKTKLNPPIGILGGTFDPIHFGHLKIAEAASNACKLSKVLFIPSFIPVHRAAPKISPTQRLEMLHIALEEYSSFEVDESEIMRQGPSYMIDTLRALQEKYPHTPFCLILGKDAFASFHHWHQWQDIINVANLIIIHRETRTEQLPNELKTFLKKHETKKIEQLHSHLAGEIYQLQIEPIDVSASHIRHEIQQGHQPINQLSEKVYQYIIDKKLYRKL